MPRKRDGLTRRQFLSETTTMAAALAAATACRTPCSSHPATFYYKA